MTRTLLATILCALAGAASAQSTTGPLHTPCNEGVIATTGYASNDVVVCVKGEWKPFSSAAPKVGAASAQTLPQRAVDKNQACIGVDGKLAECNPISAEIVTMGLPVILLPMRAGCYRVFDDGRVASIPCEVK